MHGHYECSWTYGTYMKLRSQNIYAITKIKGVRVMVFNATFNNISAISWQSVLLVEETGENRRSAACHFIT